MSEPKFPWPITRERYRQVLLQKRAHWKQLEKARERIHNLEAEIKRLKMDTTKEVLAENTRLLTLNRNLKNELTRLEGLLAEIVALAKLGDDE